MRRYKAHFGNLIAIASFAMMLSIQVFHSPLHHCHSHDGHSHDSGAFGDIKHDHSGLCDQTHSHQHAAYSFTGHHQHKHPMDCPSEDHCQLCQFLTQAVAQVQLSVVIEGSEAVTPSAVEPYPFLQQTTQAGPYVRGPPSSSFA